jgi:hypothetical protein
MAKTLELVFRTGAGKETTINLPDPKDDLTLAQAQTVMDDIIAKNIFVIKGSALTERVEARVRSSETVALA